MVVFRLRAGKDLETRGQVSDDQKHVLMEEEVVLPPGLLRKHVPSDA